jgi:hypothetical protein
MGGSSPPKSPQSPVTTQQLQQAWGGATGNIGQVAANPYPMQTYQQFAPGMSNMYGYDPTQAIQVGNWMSGQGANLYGMGNQLYQTGFDPQQQLYTQQRQLEQDQARISQASRGIQTTPYGAGLENQAMQNFDINWQNQQLQRQLAAAQGTGSLYAGGAGQMLGGQGLAAGVPQNMANFVGSLQNLGMGAYAPQQWAAGQYGNLFGQGAGAQNQAYQSQLNAWQQQQQQQNQMWSGIGQAAGTILPMLMMFSDIRLKENVKPVGKMSDGQTIYKYNFKGSPVTQIGLIAQEVEKTHPEAVGSFGGYKTVDYGIATSDVVQGV